MFVKKSEYKNLIDKISELEKRVAALEGAPPSSKSTDSNVLDYKEVMDEWLNGGKK